MKRIILIFAFTIFQFSNLQLNAQENISKPETVIIKTFEYTGIGSSYIAIIHPNKETETKELQGIKNAAAKNSVLSNAIVLQNEILKWQKTGFKILTLAVAGTESFIVTTIILTKE